MADAPTQTTCRVSDEPVTELAVEDLTPGDGAELAEGETAVLHLIAARGDTGEVAAEHVDDAVSRSRSSSPAVRSSTAWSRGCPG